MEYTSPLLLGIKFNNLGHPVTMPSFSILITQFGILNNRRHYSIPLLQTQFFSTYCNLTDWCNNTSLCKLQLFDLSFPKAATHYTSNCFCHFGLFCLHILLLFFQPVLPPVSLTCHSLSQDCSCSLSCSTSLVQTASSSVTWFFSHSPLSLSGFIIMARFNIATCKMVQLLIGTATGLAALTHWWLPTLADKIHALVHMSVTY